ncbi:hypothetical protein LSCM1_02530 [Leishmania martiniquensis]|uniref:Uncharacterized protein n=1 Tax=Leishmania martiniquensis TaxID=1580590 RepID=A0A836H2R7_9TRYP|nr:hypothetical protein LSCM1_02530 [Leishmania martiniquensis]
MHQLSVFHYVASELGHDEPVLHAVVATHRCLPPDPPEMDFMTTLPHTVTAFSSRRASSGHESLGDDANAESAFAAAAQDTPAAPLAGALTVAQELVNLNEKLTSWKVRRLAELQVPEGIRSASRLSQLEVAMEQRLARRRAGEQNRAQKRMQFLLTSLGPRIDKQLQLLTRDFVCEQAPVNNSLGALTSDDVKDSACVEKVVTAAAAAAPPPASSRACILCEQEYYVALQGLALEERSARQSLRHNMWNVHRLTRLVEDEAAFRRSIETSEGTWRDLLDAESPADAEAGRL